MLTRAGLKGDNVFTAGRDNVLSFLKFCNFDISAIPYKILMFTLLVFCQTTYGLVALGIKFIIYRHRNPQVSLIVLFITFAILIVSSFLLPVTTISVSGHNLPSSFPAWLWNRLISLGPSFLTLFWLFHIYN